MRPTGAHTDTSGNGNWHARTNGRWKLEGQSSPFFPWEGLSEDGSCHVVSLQDGAIGFSWSRDQLGNAPPEVCTLSSPDSFLSSVLLP